MAVKIKRIFLALISLQCVFVSCKPSKIYQGPKPIHWTHFKKILTDWNARNSETMNAVVLDITEKKDYLNEVVGNIPEENPIIIARPDMCRKIERRKAFVVIVASFVNEVNKVCNNLLYFSSKNPNSQR